MSAGPRISLESHQNFDQDACSYRVSRPKGFFLVRHCVSLKNASALRTCAPVRECGLSAAVKRGCSVLTGKSCQSAQAQKAELLLDLACKAGNSVTLRKWAISRCQSAFLANGMLGLIGRRPCSAGASIFNLRVLCPKGHGVPSFSGEMSCP